MFVICYLHLSSEQFLIDCYEAGETQAQLHLQRSHWTALCNSQEAKLAQGRRWVAKAGHLLTATLYIVPMRYFPYISLIHTKKKILYLIIKSIRVITLYSSYELLHLLIFIPAQYII